ncbi:MAG: 3-deoxy-D-manno-octulosonic acid transferase [Pyrinomonadaceae bacterium]
MYFLYNIALWVGFLALTPRFLYDKLTDGKWAAGFSQRFGAVPAFDAEGRKVVLLHCVSVGEANAALPLARKLKETFPHIALVVSTTTRTGQQVARDAYAGVADLVVYFPFDLRGSVKRFLRQTRPDIVLLTETELWFNFLRQATRSGARVAIVNGRLSARSFRRYSRIKGFMKQLLGYVDLALMQGDADAERLKSLGADAAKVTVAGNLKFDVDTSIGESEITREFRGRFGITADAPLILAASTHAPEEQILLDAFAAVRERARSARLMLVPRHPERFDEVAALISSSGFGFVRRSQSQLPTDAKADVILLDSIGELKAVYPLAEIVFVGGSLIPHGGQSIFEPAAVGKPIVTGPHTANFDAAVKEFLSRDALVQLMGTRSEDLAAALIKLLSDRAGRQSLGQNALAVMESNRGAVERTIEYLAPLLTSR